MASCPDVSSVIPNQIIASLVNATTILGLSFFLAVLFGKIFATLDASLRGHGYQTASLRGSNEAEGLTIRFGIPSDRSTARTALASQARSALLDSLHRKAISDQNHYHAKLSMAYGALVFAFVCTAAGTTFLPKTDCIKTLTASIDAMALLVFFCISILARRRLALWIHSRSVNELGRQFIEMTALLPLSESTSNRPDLTSVFEERMAAIEAGFRTQSPKASTEAKVPPVQYIMAHWTNTRSALNRTEHSIPVVDILRYLHRRPLRQYVWFGSSYSRLKGRHELHRHLLAALFWCAVIVAVLEFFAHHMHLDDGGMLTFLLLIFSGVGATASGHYFGTNARSLMHRYQSQRERIGDWLRAFTVRYGATLSYDGDWPPDCINDTMARIAEFEELMIVELLDWISVTAKDSIELEP
jgi:hypothetical protein